MRPVCSERGAGDASAEVTESPTLDDVKTVSVQRLKHFLESSLDYVENPPLDHGVE